MRKQLPTHIFFHSSRGRKYLVIIS